MLRNDKGVRERTRPPPSAFNCPILSDISLSINVRIACLLSVVHADFATHQLWQQVVAQFFKVAYLIGISS